MDTKKTKLQELLSNWLFWLGVILIALSTFLYTIHFKIFHDAHHIFIYMLGDIAFVPIEVLFVTLIIHRLLGSREKKEKLKKLNMVIGVFFSEVGSALLKNFAKCDIEAKEVSNKLLVKDNWTDKNFANTKVQLVSYEYNFDISKGNLSHLKSFFGGQREFLLSLLTNPNLLDHDTFTDLLWAVFHLMEELEHRKNVSKFEESDADHLAIDIKRVYHLLILEWLDYMRHLKNSYPFLFSLALRTNPFDPDASVEVK